MQEVTTIPGKTYAVECAGEVVITNNETGAIAAQGDGSGQVLFTACGNSYSVSNDTAKVVALFKLAPRLKLTLLQGVAGGLLPAGYTALEYLESSGTQNILLPTEDMSEVGKTWVQKVDMQFLSESSSLVGWSSKAGLYWGLLSGAFSLGNGIGFASDGNRHVFRASFFRRVETDTFTAFVSELTFNRQTVQRAGQPSTLPDQWLYGIFAPSFESAGYAGSIRMWGCKCWSAAAKFDLIPALRNSDGVAGMFDTVSKQFFTNAGTGTFGYRVKTTGEVVSPMSLRDPYRVAPSGVYARKLAETELEIVADTEETSGDGWEWFANTGEAYEHFGIVIQEDFN